MTTSLANARRVLHRALSLGLLSVRFTMEFSTKGRGVIEAEDLYLFDQMNHIFNSSECLRAVLTPNEVKLVKAELGEWSNELLLLMSWTSEMAGSLLWALGEIKTMPSFDEPFGLDILNAFFNNLSGDISWAIPLSQKAVMFRKEEEILCMKKQVETVIQRGLFSLDLRTRGRKFPTKSYDELFHLTELGLPVGASNDLQIFGKEFCDLSESEERSLMPIITSRAVAFRWILNPNQKWDDITIEDLYTLPE